MKTIFQKFGSVARFGLVAALYGGVVVAPAHAQLSQVKINEIYGAGGAGTAGMATAATLNRDYIELFNTGSATVVLDGSSLQYASAGNNFSGVIPLSGSILPGRYFLVATGPVGTIGAALPTPDATGPTGVNLGGSAGKVLLTSGTTLLTAATPTTAGVVDFVGYGTANAFEGTRAPAPANNQSSIARATPGADTDNNGVDFVNVTPPDPDNSSVGATGPEVSFSAGTATVLENAATVTLTVTRTSGTGTSTVDFATANGTATAGADYTASSGTVSFAEGETSKTIVITLLDDTLVEANETFTVGLSNPSSGTTLGASTLATVTIRENDRVPGALLINEIKNDAPGNDAPQEYIELRGPAGALLTNVSLVYVPGDSAFPASIGTARQVMDLSGASFGSNGLLVIKSPTSGPAIPAGTTVVTDTGFDATGATGAFLNGTGTFLLVFAPSAPIVEGTDYDTNNDGILDAGNALASAERLDSVGFNDGNDGDLNYSPVVLRLGSGSTGGSDTAGNSTPEAENAAPDAATRFPTNNTPESAAAFFFGELSGTTNDSLDYDETTPGTTVSGNFPTGYDLTPGAANTLPTPPAPSGPTGYAISGTNLYSFNTSTPGTPTLVGDTTLAFAGIDFNPDNGLLYGLVIGSNARLYTINTATGAATAVGAGFPLSGTVGANSYNLTNQQIGFDFNPKTIQNDGSIRIRVTAQNGSDLRLNATTGGVAAVDGALLANGASTSIVGSAYTNNVGQMGGATTLYDVSDTTETLYVQNPPNNGTLVAVGTGLGIDVKAVAGFDIFTDASGTGNTGFLATDSDGTGGSELFNVNLTTGTAAPAGNFGALVVSDIAIAPLGTASVPFVRSITRAAGTQNPTGASSVNFTVTFSEAVTGVDAADFLVTVTGGATGATVSSVSGSGTTYTVTVSGYTGTGSGTIRLDVADNDTIVDATANPLGGTNTGNANFQTGEVVTLVTAATSGVVISEFRLSGPGTGSGNGATDEFIELMNTTSTALNITSWNITAGAVTIPLSGTIPAGGHFLVANSSGYSLSSYSGSTGDATYTSDIAPTSSLTLNNAAGAPVDFVGAFTVQPGASTNQYSFVRRLESGVPLDTGTDTTDFNLVDISAMVSTVGATGVGPLTAPRLGAPGPQSTLSPIQRNGQVTLVPINAATVGTPAEGRYASKNSPLDNPNGRQTIRRTFTNSTGAKITQLRFRIVAGTNGTSNTAGVADLRALTSAGVTVGTTKKVQGITLEAPSTPTVAPSGFGPNPASAGNGGGLNSSWTVDLSATSPLLLTDGSSAAGGIPIGKSLNVEFLFAIVTNGTYRVVVDTEVQTSP